MSQKLLMPTIEFEDFYMRPIRLSDYNDLFEIASKDVVTRYLSWNKHEHPSETKLVIKNYLLKKVAKNQPETFAIIHKQENKMIGTCELAEYKPLKKEIALGYIIHPDYWNRGIATEVCLALIDIAFQQLKVETIFVKHHQDNHSSQRVIEKCNFKFIKVERIETLNKLHNEFVRVYKLEKMDYIK